MLNTDTGKSTDMKRFRVRGKSKETVVYDKVLGGANKADAWGKAKPELDKLGQQVHIYIDEV